MAGAVNDAPFDGLVRETVGGALGGGGGGTAPLAATFARVQQKLGPAVGKEVVLISVSVDPVTDVPPRMKAYLSKFGAQPGWLFIGGAKLDVDALLRALGAYVSDKNDHTPMILVGNEKAGFWTRAFGLASADKLAGIIADATRKMH